MLKNKKGISLVEVLIVVLIISVGVLSIITIVGNILRQTNIINQKIIALNLAKEGIETIYQIRNTNILINTGSNRESHWLNIDPYNSNIAWMGSGSYIIITGTIDEGEEYQLLSVINTTLDIDYQGKDWNTANNKHYKMCLSAGDDVSRDACPGDVDNLTKYGRFFRAIEGLGVYNKEGNSFVDCSNPINSMWCDSNTAKEYRFCARVEYYELGRDRKQVQLCALMTNFFDSD